MIKNKFLKSHFFRQIMQMRIVGILKQTCERHQTHVSVSLYSTEIGEKFLYAEIVIFM